MEDFDRMVMKVQRVFHDRKKVALWFKTPNPLLGNIAPMVMYKNGRGEKLEQFIDDMATLNQTDDPQRVMTLKVLGGGQ